jgi:hypothetical protein
MKRSHNSPRRDALGQACFWLHVAILIFIVAGWAVPQRGILMFYLVFLPLVVAQWRLNRGACVLNNTENWLRHGRWRAPDRNAEEGAWFRTLVRNLTGIALGQRAMDAVIYTAMAIFWALAAIRLFF